MAAQPRRIWSNLLASCLAVALAIAWPLGAHASPGAAAPSAEGVAEQRRSAAKAKFDEGVAGYKEQRFADAVKAFLEADSIAPSANLSFNVARAYERLGDTSSALRWYRDFLRRSPSAPNAKDVELKVAQLAASLSERGVQQLSVLSEPVGATVLVDDQNLGVTPLTRDLPPGKHRLRLRLAGYREHEQELELEPRTPRDVSVELQQAPTPAPAAAVPLPSRGPGPAANQGRQFGIAPYVVLGVGAASMLGALGFELGRRSADDAAKDAPQTEFQGHFDTMKTRQTTARLLAGVGGALLVTGGVLFYIDWQRRSAPQVAFGCDPSSCGFVAKGSFQ